MISRLHRRLGQGAVETLLLLPLFLIFVFGMLQACFLAIALITTSYAAGSIARKAVAENDYSFNPGNYEPRLRKLLFGGIQFHGLKGAVKANGPISYTVTVTACTKVTAMPMMSYLLNHTDAGSGDCSEGGSPVAYVNQAPYFFVVKATASARMNVKGS